ncbi:hypothetical protein [Aureispira sp. CCB-QB1]|uniref:hypothetical protein n=1 Tax=Aureispira sp. CCB-QB1 TaxID=1313421 RepID=UPI0006985047|nr:hypothetical protein [Aureispira sp. CCB-QB1]
MFYSAIGYLLTLFMAFTIIPLVAFFLRMLLIMLFSRIYWGFTGNKSPVNLLQFSIKLAHPIGFTTAIFHGFAALWMGVVFFNGMDLKLDLFLPGILIFTFIWFGIKRINNPAKVNVDNRITTTDSEGQETTIIINPEIEDNLTTEPLGQDPMKILNEQMKNQLKDQTKEFIQGNTIIGLIGKVTGVVLGAMSYIPF